MSARAARVETRAEMLGACAAVVLLVVGRSFVFVAFEQVHFDADQAVMGLMAKHIAQGRAFPVYQYAQSYILAVEAWLAAPFIALFGLSVTVLRLPLVLLNVGAGLLMLCLFARELRLRPGVALVPVLFFAAAPPVLAAELVTALGVEVEPFVFVLLLWVVRARPALFGAVFLVGFLTREFTVYAVTSLILIEALQGRLWQRDALRAKGVALLVFAVGWLVVGFLDARADHYGPGVAPEAWSVPRSNLSVVASAICPDVDVARMCANLSSLVTTQMATLLGTAPFRLAGANLRSPTTQGAQGLWPAFGVVMLAALTRLLWVLWRDSRAGRTARVTPPDPEPDARVDALPERSRLSARTTLWFPMYLGLTGLQSGVVWALSRCDALSPLTLRYGLLTVLVPVALVAAFLAVERRTLNRALMILFVLVWTTVSVRAHGRLLAYYLDDPGPTGYRLVADELLARGIRYAAADYWAAYMIVFLTDERVTVTATDYARVAEYEDAVARHATEAVLISRVPCAGGEPIGWLYLCRLVERE